MLSICSSTLTYLSHFPWLLLIRGWFNVSYSYLLPPPFPSWVSLSFHSSCDLFCYSFAPSILSINHWKSLPLQYLLVLLLCCKSSSSQFLLSSWLHPLDICCLLYFWVSSYPLFNLNWIPTAISSLPKLPLQMHPPLTTQQWILHVSSRHQLTKCVNYFLHFHFVSVPFLLSHFFFHHIRHRKVSYLLSFSSPFYLTSDICPTYMDLSFSFSVFRNKDFVLPVQHITQWLAHD